MQETWVWSLGQEDTLEKAMATYSSILAQRIPRMEEPGGLQSTGSQRVGHIERLHFHFHTHTHTHTNTHTHNGIILTHKKEQIWISSSEVNEPRACYTEWSQSERGKQISYMKAFIRTREKRYWWTYLQGRNGDADVENRLMDTAGEGEDGTNGESSIDVYTQSRVKCIASEKLPCNTESPAWHSVMS